MGDVLVARAARGPLGMRARGVPSHRQVATPRGRKRCRSASTAPGTRPRRGGGSSADNHVHPPSLLALRRALRLARRETRVRACRAAFQREWRLRRLGEELAEAENSAPPPRGRLRGPPARRDDPLRPRLMAPPAGRGGQHEASGPISRRAEPSRREGGSPLVKVASGPEAHEFSWTLGPCTRLEPSARLRIWPPRMLMLPSGRSVMLARPQRSTTSRSPSITTRSPSASASNAAGWIESEICAAAAARRRARRRPRRRPPDRPSAGQAKAPASRTHHRGPWPRAAFPPRRNRSSGGPRALDWLRTKSRQNPASGSTFSTATDFR